MAMESWPPLDKFQHLKLLVAEWHHCKSCLRKELEFLVGHLSHACKVFKVAAAPGYSLLAKAVSCAISVVNGRSYSRRSCYKPCTKRDKCFCGHSCGYQWPFLVNRFVTFLRLAK